MNLVDIIIILALIMSFIVGFKHGFIRQVVSLIGIILTYVIAYNFKGYIGNFFCLIFPFSKFSGTLSGLTTLNIIIYELIAFIIIFALVFVIYEIILNVSKLLEKIIDSTIILTIPSKLLGGVVSLVEGYLLIFIVIILLSIPLRSTELIDNSYLSNQIVYNTPVLSSSANNLTESIGETITLVDKISHKRISIDEANKELLRIELKYKIIDKTTAKSLNDSNKISINNIDELLED